MILDDREYCKKFHKRCDINDHWKPFSSKCSFCGLNYRIIGKSEAFETDRKFIGKLAGVNFQDLGMGSSRLLSVHKLIDQISGEL